MVPGTGCASERAVGPIALESSLSPAESRRRFASRERASFSFSPSFPRRARARVSRLSAKNARAMHSTSASATSALPACARSGVIAAAALGFVAAHARAAPSAAARRHSATAPSPASSVDTHAAANASR